MQTHIALFLQHLEYERRLSKHTIWAYKADLEHFLVWAKTKICTEDILYELSHYHLREYLSFCFHRFKNVTIARRLSALRSFFRYLVREGVINSSVADSDRKPESHQAFA